MPSLKLPKLNNLPLGRRAAEPVNPYPTEEGYRDAASATTRFFRNYPQLLALARAIPQEWQSAAKLTSLHIGGSLGCEALSFLIVMREQQPAFQINAISTDLDPTIIERARRMEYAEEFFQPLREKEGGNPENLREKWFQISQTKPRILYHPVRALERLIKFQTLDIRVPPRNLQADIVFCQNVLIHMERELAARCLTNVIQLVRPQGILVCAGMNLELKRMIADAGFNPITMSIREIHDTWSSQRVHFQENPGKIYFELEDFDAAHPDWEVRYSTIFVRA